MTDYRLKENRREAFIRWYAWSLKYKDCDPAVWMTNYLNDRYEHNTEERLWLCWLFGNTYYLATAWVLKNEFPDYELATVDRLNWWNSEYYKRLRYQTDTKYNKGHLPIMFESYAKNIGKGQQLDYFTRLLGDNEHDSFRKVYSTVKKNFYKFGRYTTWFYLQHLYSTCGIPVVPDNLLFSDYSGSRSHRNGFLFATGKEDLHDQKLTTRQYEELEDEAKSFLEEMNRRYPEYKTDINYYTMETCLCSFKKIFREHHGRYLGYYLDRQAEEISTVQSDGWYGIEWNVLWQARDESLDRRLTNKRGINKEKYAGFVNTGEMGRLDWMYNDIKSNHFFSLESLSL
jgi:hypothetical protein